MPVARHDDVQFHRVGAAFDRVPERRDRILGMRGARPAMSHHALPRVSAFGYKRSTMVTGTTNDDTPAPQIAAMARRIARTRRVPAQTRARARYVAEAEIRLLRAPPHHAHALHVLAATWRVCPTTKSAALAQQIGFEGIDLTVYIGGHVDPRVTSVDLIRAFESIRAADLEVAMITTSITTAMDQTCYPVLYLTGHSQIPCSGSACGPIDDSVDIRQRILQVRRDVIQVVALGQRCEICASYPNHAGPYVGEATWDAESILAGMDPRWIAHMFDPAEATIEGGLGGWETALRLVCLV